MNSGEVLTAYRFSRKTVDPEYYETRSFAGEFADAIKSGALVRAVAGKSILEAAREKYLSQKKSESVSLRLPKPLVAEIKRQAADASIPGLRI